MAQGCSLGPLEPGTTVDVGGMAGTHAFFAKAMGAEFDEDSMLFDALTGNSDRHFGTAGMLFAITENIIQKY